MRRSIKYNHTAATAFARLNCLVWFIVSGQLDVPRTWTVRQSRRHIKRLLIKSHSFFKAIDNFTNHAWWMNVFLACVLRGISCQQKLKRKNQLTETGSTTYNRTFSFWCFEISEDSKPRRAGLFDRRRTIRYGKRLDCFALTRESSQFTKTLVSQHQVIVWQTLQTGHLIFRFWFTQSCVTLSILHRITNNCKNITPRM